MLDINKLDKSVPVPLYFQLKNILLEAIKCGDYTVDHIIPTEKLLSELFQISRTTVRQAITEMVQEGWLYRIASKGTFVARRKIKQDFIKQLESFNDQILRTGCSPSTKVFEMKTTEMPKQLCVRFGVPENKPFIYLFRRRYADSEPIVTVETYLPTDKCMFVFVHDFNNESLYKVLATNDKTRICRVNRIMEAVAANTQDVENLSIRRGKPVQLATTIGYNHEDEPIEYSIARYRGDRNRFEVDLMIKTGSA
jgi:GntR family transcriptional regulator